MARVGLGLLAFALVVLVVGESSVGQKIVQPNEPARLDPDTTRKAPGLPAPPKSAPAEPDQVTRFDPRAVEMRFQDGRWWLQAGDLPLKDFGKNESDARKALYLLRALEVNEWATIGKPQPVFEFFLIDGKAPAASAFGLELSRFRPDKLEVKPHLDGWVLVEGPKPLFRFSERDQADRAVALIRKHQFDRVGYVGRTQQTMTVFFSSVHEQLRPADLRGERPKFERPKLQKPKDGELVKVPSRADTPSHADKPPVPPTTVKTTRLPFDYRQAVARKVDGSWQVMLGTYSLKTFGESERDAREALKVIQYYRLNELHQFVDEEGHADARNRFEYFLAQGKAPMGRMFGQESTLFEPRQLALKEHEGQWWLAYHEQRLLPFADEAHARQALEIIRKHGFDQLCHVGGRDTGLMYFVRTR